eukprot:12684816-Alexandrium_andersonii.AAC.1
MCRHIVQTELHSASAPWLRRLWLSGASAESVEQDAKSECPKSSPASSQLPAESTSAASVAAPSPPVLSASSDGQFFYTGFDSFQMKAWRQSTAPKACKEYTDEFDINYDLPDDEPVTAVFSDGYRSTIAEFTVGDAKLRHEAL